MSCNVHLLLKIVNEIYIQNLEEMDEANKYVILFHSVQGNTLKEKRKHFNEFITSIKSNIPREELNDFVESIIPETFIEEIFKIELMMELKRTQLLLKELKMCSRVFMRKLLKNWRVFGEIFLNVTADDFVNDILPHLSYSLKLKLLNGIQKNVKSEPLLDEYFVALEKKYGLKMATLILPGCSIELIKSKVEKFHLKLPPSHLKTILKKDKEFVEFYFDVINMKYENINLTDEYLTVLKYLARIDSRLYWELYEKYNLRVKFGKYMTPNMIKMHKDIAREGHKVLSIFHLLQMHKTMKKEGNFDKFLLNLYPETHDKFVDEFLTYQVMKLLQKGPCFEQFHLINSIFSQKYNKNLLDYHNYFTEDLLKMTPIKERESILDIKVMQDEKLCYLYSTAISVPIYKKRIQHSSDANARNQHAISLYQTCLVNRDKVGLLNVVRYVLSRHKNDRNFMQAFLDKVISWPNIACLSEEHWQHISNLHNALKAIYPNNYLSAEFYRKYLCYLIKNDKPITEIVKEEIKQIMAGEKYDFYSIMGCYEKFYWDEIAKCIDEYDGSEKYQLLCNKFLHSMSEYKVTLKAMHLIDYERFIYKLNIDQWVPYNLLKAGIKCDYEPMHDIFWKSNRPNNGLICWYAKNNPDKLLQNIDKLPNLFGSYKLEKSLKKFRLLCDVDVLEMLRTYALENFHNENQEKVKFSVKTLAVLAPESLLELIKPFLPKSDGKVDLDGSVDTINLQQVIACSLSYIEAHSKTYPIILKFCIGDYLKFGLSSLYSVTYNTPEIEIKNYLDKLANTAVSVRKHVLFLARHLLKPDEFYPLLNKWSKKEKNLSMRNIIFKKSIEYFVDNPTDDIWILLKTNLASIDPDDREMYDYLLKYEKIPPGHLPEYIEVIYKIISKNPDVLISEKKFQLIRGIPRRIIDKLSDEFLRKIIKETTCKEDGTNFHWLCVFHVDKARRLSLFDENFAALEKYLEVNDFRQMQNSELQSTVIKFLRDFVHLAIELKGDQELIQKFMSTWNSLFHFEYFLETYILIELAELYFESGLEPYKLGLKINKLVYDYIEKYNSSILDSFCAQLDDFLCISSIKDKDELFRFLDGLLYARGDANVYVVLMYFLPRTIPEMDNSYAKFLPVFEAIEACDTPFVRYHFDDYLNKNYLKSKY